MLHHEAVLGLPFGRAAWRGQDEAVCVQALTRGDRVQSCVLGEHQVEGSDRLLRKSVLLVLAVEKARSTKRGDESELLALLRTRP